MSAYGAKMLTLQRFMRRFAHLTILLLMLTPLAGRAQGNRIVYGLSFEPSGFDPHRNASSELGIPLRQVYDTLVYRDPDTGAYVPGLASSWEVAPDGLAYTFTLRQDVVFHDGTPFNALAVAANLDRIVDPAVASQKAVFMLGPYAGYQIVDDFTIRILLAAPYSSLLDSLSQVYLGIASPAALSSVSIDRYQFNQVGSGPYEFVEYVTGDRVVIRRAANYTWGPAFYEAPESGAIDEVEFRFYGDPTARALALEAGDAEVMGELLPLDARALSLDEDIILKQVTIPGQPLQFLINTTRFPTGSLPVRQALLFGTNREAIVESVFQRFSPVAWGPLAATTTFYTPTVQGSYPYDIARARALLEGAGLRDADGNTFFDADGGDLTIRVIVPPWGLIPEVAQLLQDQWRSIGIRAELVPVATRAALFEAVSGGNYNLVAWYEFGSDPAFLSNYFATDGTLNWTGYSNPLLDSLLGQASASQDETTRAALYTQVQQLIMEDALILPIRDYVNVVGMRSSMVGLNFDYYGWFPLLMNASLVFG
jgi:peptide/nickel transport system substrate-binding protein